MMNEDGPCSPLITSIDSTVDLSVEIDKMNDDYDSSDLEDIDENQHDTQRDKLTKEYSNICQKLGIPVVSTYVKNISNDAFSLAHRGIGDETVRGITISLQRNLKVLDANFADNRIGIMGALHIGKMFGSNCTLRRLNLSKNQISNNGLRNILTLVEKGNDLRYLNVSDNGISDNAILDIERFLTVNTSLEEFDLSKNDLGERAGKGLRKGLEKNNGLEVLNLSWNKLRFNSTIEIAKGLKKNKYLRKLDISWNGVEDEASFYLGESIGANKCLTELDLSHNRITSRGAMNMSTGLAHNSTLRCLHLKENLIQASGVQALLEALVNNPKSKIETVNLEGVWVSEMNRLLIEELSKKEPCVFIPVAGYIEAMNTIDLSIMRRELITVFKQYVSRNRLRVLDLYNQWDKDRDDLISRGEFRVGVKGALPFLTNYQIEILVNWFDPDMSDGVNYSEFVKVIQL